VNGLPASATDWIAEGTLADLYRSRNWAARTGAQFRPAVQNLILSAGDGTAAESPSGGSLAEMISRVDRGLLVCCLWYIRTVDPQSLLLTGLTRDGVYLIEDGQVRGMVNNFRFNESPLDLLSRVVEVGRTVPALSREWSEDFTRTAMPALRVADFNMSTVSQAS
jgi:predicted Zn-dependent protease